MIVRSPAAAVLAGVALVFSAASCVLGYHLAGSEPALVAIAMAATTLALAGALTLGRTAGTTLSLGLLVGWAAIAVATRDSVAPGRTAVLGVLVYLVADAAFTSIALRQPVPVAGLLTEPWLARVGLALTAGVLSYLLLRSLADPPDASAGLALAAVALVLVTLLAVVGVATWRRPPPAPGRGVPS